MAQLFKWLTLFAVLIWGVADARDVGRSPSRAGGNPILSPDGSFIEGSGATFSPFPGSAASLRTRYGTLTFSTRRNDIQPGWGGGDMYELYLNGHRIAPNAQRAIVNYGGASQYSEEDQNCWLFVDWQISANGGYYTIGCSAPGFSDAPGPPVYSPPYTPSTDGSSITAPSGTLVTSEGIWSWGPAATGGGYRIKLNGTYIWTDDTQGNGIALQVNSNGHLFIQQPDTSWRVYLDYVRVSANPPTGQAIPLHVDMIPTAAPVSPACGDMIFRLPNVGSVGRLAGYLTVAMSDGSLFAGTVTIAPNGGITLFNASVGIDGVITLTTKQNPLYGLDNFAGVSLTVSQNGTTVGGYHFWFDTGSC